MSSEGTRSGVSTATKVKRILARRAKWATALRSGEYPQTIGQLQVLPEFEDLDGDLPAGFCCLGVCTKEAIKRRVLPASMFRPDDGCAPSAVADWLGLDELGVGETNILRFLDDSEDESHDFVSLADLNDEFKYNFDEIADLIEEPGVLRIYVDGVEVADHRVETV